MPSAPAFQHYVSDFLSHPIVALMSAQEIGAYWMLVNYCWKLDGLPNDIEELAIYARLPVETFEPMWTRRIQRCFQFENNVWVHPHLEEEKLKHQSIREVRQKASASRWDKQKDANAMQMQSSSSSSSTSTSKEKKEETIVSSKKVKNGSRISDDFYPSEKTIKWAMELIPGLNLELRVKEFKNYWSSKTGKDATKTDWDKTFQNRIIQISEWQSTKEVKNGSNQNGNGKYPAKKSNADIYDSYGYFG